MCIIHCRALTHYSFKNKSVPHALKFNFISTFNLDFQEEKEGLELWFDEVKIRIKKWLLNFRLNKSASQVTQSVF